MVLKVTAFMTAIIAVAYLLMLIFAPNQLQRLGAILRSSLGAGTVGPVTIASAEKGGHYHRLGIMVQSEMKQRWNQEVTVKETGGTIENIFLLQEDKADFALIQGAVPESGSIHFQGISAVAAIGWQYLHLIVRKDSAIKSFKDLTGKTVSLGPETSGNAALGSLVMDYFHPDARPTTVHTPISTAETDFHTGRIEAFFATYDLHAPNMEQLMNTGKFTLARIPEAEAIAYTIPGCFAAVLPHSLYGRYRDIPSVDDSPFHTLKIKTLLIARKGVRTFVIRNLLEVLYSRRFIKNSRLTALNEEKGQQVFDLPLHPAAKRYYDRNKPVTADKYEIGSALLALMLFVASVISFIVNRYRARKMEKLKQNIIPFFEELLQYSKKMSYVNDIDQLKELLDRMMAMQRRAEAEWLNGDLDTEHMENLYAIYGIRCENIFHKMTLLQLIKNYGMLEASCHRLQDPSEKKDLG